MNKIILAFAIAISSFSCQKKMETIKIDNEKYVSFGDSISKDGALSKEEMFAKYAGLNEGDTINVKFRSRINDVCSKKGCWMNMDLVNDDKVFVKFKDYAFFMPLNSKDDEAIVNGKAYLSIESVDELKHYAKDAGKSQAAIDSIKEPKTSYAFMADGVLIKQ
jgi:hypothetical protein